MEMKIGVWDDDEETAVDWKSELRAVLGSKTAV